MSRLNGFVCYGFIGDKRIVNKNSSCNLFIGKRMLTLLLLRLNKGTEAGLCKVSRLSFKAGLCVVRHCIKISKSKGSSGCCLVYRVINIIRHPERVRICAHISGLYRINRLLGDNEAVKSANGLNRFKLAENSGGRLKSIYVYAVGSIPFSIVKILVELTSTLALFIFLFLISILYRLINEERTDGNRQKCHYHKDKLKE